MLHRLVARWHAPEPLLGGRCRFLRIVALDVLAAEITENLQAAVDQFSQIQDELSE